MSRTESLSTRVDRVRSTSSGDDARRTNGPGYAILGVGEYLPPHVRDNSWWGRSAETRRPSSTCMPDLPGSVFDGQRGRPIADDDDLAARQRVFMARCAEDRFRGTRERRVCGPDLPSSTMEIRAARAALSDAGVGAEDLDAIVVASMPGDHYCPNNATAILEALGCRSIPCFAVESACTSFLSGLAQLHGLLALHGLRHGLIVVSVQYSQLTAPDDRLYRSVGDGAGAAVVGPVSPGDGLLSHVLLGHPQWRDAVRCSTRDGERFISGRSPIWGHTCDDTASRELIMNCSRLARDSVALALDRAGLDAREVSHFFCHQATGWMSEACQAACGLDCAQRHDTFPRFANMGAANLPVNMTQAKRAGDLRPGDVVATFSIGMGVTTAASVMRWT
ncbi:MAG: 3-oxoacyl-[acyl-carrier-protein] synthase III C-terminal domain-containing protein [Nannocystaceae bacterium]